MKKTYINPSILVVRLAMTRPLAASPAATLNTSDDAAVNGDELDVKSVSDVNVWDDEW